MTNKPPFDQVGTRESIDPEPQIKSSTSVDGRFKLFFLLCIEYFFYFYYLFQILTSPIDKDSSWCTRINIYG